MDHLKVNKNSKSGFTHFDPEQQYDLETKNDSMTVTGVSDLTTELLHRKFGKKKSERLSVTAWREDAAFLD
ncbi:MAG: hypothetical protein KDC45_10270 [Bacteroidetes bacterium]|nr:hypothetical protein [Bacteroidota bacterium]